MTPKSFHVVIVNGRVADYIGYSYITDSQARFKLVIPEATGSSNILPFISPFVNFALTRVLA